MSIVKSFSFPKGNVRGDIFYIKHNVSSFTVIDCYLLTNSVNKENHCCPEIFYHKVSCLYESSSGTLTGSSALL